MKDAKGTLSEAYLVVIGATATHVIPIFAAIICRKARELEMEYEGILGFDILKSPR